MIRTLLRYVTPSDSPLYECRECGTTLEEESERCHACDSTEIARYDIEDG